jgi:ABC-2 type transport system permease protein
MKLFKIARREYLERVRKKSFLIGTILGPVVMGGFILIPMLIMRATPERSESIAILDYQGSVYEKLEEALSDTLGSGKRMFTLTNVDIGRRDLDQIKEELNVKVERDILDGYVVVPEDIVERGEAVFYGKRVGNIKMIGRLRSELSNVVIARRLSARGMDYDQVRKMVSDVELETIMVTEGEEKKAGFDMLYFSSFIMIMMLYMTILLWGVAIQRSIISEKNNRVVEVLLSSVKPFDLLGGKVLGVGAVGLTQYVIWALFAAMIALRGVSVGGLSSFEIFSPLTLVFFIVFFLLGFLFYSTLFAGIGSICNSDQEAQQLQMPVVMCLAFTILIPLMVIQNPDGMFATVVSLIPLFTPIVMFMRINVLTPPTWQIALSIAIMISSIIIAARLAAGIFRIGILMYGKRPEIREIVRWIKRA